VLRHGNSIAPALATLLLFLLPFVHRAGGQGEITFAFGGNIQYQQSGAVPGLDAGHSFQGSFTFDPSTPGVAQIPPDNTLDTEYWAVTSWYISIPAGGISFGGTVGEIAVGNNTPWHASDRYVVTMYPGDAQPPILIAGHAVRFIQIDLFDFGSDVGADMLLDSSLPTQPPDFALIPAPDRTGRFVFEDASYQNRMTSLAVVPEPSQFVFVLMGSLAFAVFLGGTKRRDTPSK
jgi:hypothetical protein